jgi:hypothetical protein
LETEKNYLKEEIERLTNIIDESPDPVELAEMKGNFAGTAKTTRRERWENSGS